MPRQKVAATIEFGRVAAKDEVILHTTPRLGNSSRPGDSDAPRDCFVLRLVCRQVMEGGGAQRDT